MSNHSVWAVPGMRVLAVVTLLGFSGFAALLPLAPLWAVHGGASEAGAGLVNGVLLAATVATQFGVPTLLHRFGGGPVLAAGLALLGVGALGHLLGDDLWLILTLAAVRGAGFGILTVTGSSAAGLLVDPARRGAAIGAYGLAVALPNVLLLPLGPVAVERWGFAPMFCVAALPLLGVPLTSALARHLHSTDDLEHESTGGRPTWPLISAALILLAVTLAGAGVLTFAPQLVRDQTVVTAALFLMGLVAALARWRAGTLADRDGPRRLLVPLMLVTAASMGLIAWAVVDHDLPGARTPLLLLGCATLGLSYGALQNLTLVLAFEAVPREETHTASAIWNIGFDGGTALGSVLIGALAAGVGFPTGLALAGAVSLLTIPLALRRR